MKEALAIQILCSVFGGVEEVRHDYVVGIGPSFIKVDCENDEYVMEMGLDKRTSFDSVHQAVFASLITGKKPMIVIIDTDLREKKDEYQIRLVAEKLGIEYRSIYINEIVRIREFMDRQLENTARENEDWFRGNFQLDLFAAFLRDRMAFEIQENRFGADLWISYKSYVLYVEFVRNRKTPSKVAGRRSGASGLVRAVC